MRNNKERTPGEPMDRRDWLKLAGAAAAGVGMGIGVLLGERKKRFVTKYLDDQKDKLRAEIKQDLSVMQERIEKLKRYEAACDRIDRLSLEEKRNNPDLVRELHQHLIEGIQIKREDYAKWNNSDPKLIPTTLSNHLLFLAKLWEGAACTLDTPMANPPAEVPFQLNNPAGTNEFGANLLHDTFGIERNNGSTPNADARFFNYAKTLDVQEDHVGIGPMFVCTDKGDALAIPLPSESSIIALYYPTDVDGVGTIASRTGQVSEIFANQKLLPLTTPGAVQKFMQAK